MKKILSIALSVLLITSCFITTASAETITKSTKIKLDEIYVTIPYAENNINIVREENDKEVRVVIYDKYTGEELEAYGEILDNISTKFSINSRERLNKLNAVTAGIYSNKTYYKDKEVGPCICRLYVEARVYSENSYRNFIKVNDTYWREASSGTWKIERDTSDAEMVDTNNIVVHGGCNIVVTTTESTTGTFSYDSLVGFGFSVEADTETTYHARTTIDDFRYTYSLY